MMSRSTAEPPMWTDRISPMSPPWSPIAESSRPRLPGFCCRRQRNVLWILPSHHMKEPPPGRPAAGPRSLSIIGGLSPLVYEQEGVAVHLLVVVREDLDRVADPAHRREHVDPEGVRGRSGQLGLFAGGPEGGAIEADVAAVEKEKEGLEEAGFEQLLFELDQL